MILKILLILAIMILLAYIWKKILDSTKENSRAAFICMNILLFTSSSMIIIGIMNSLFNIDFN